MKEDLKNWCVLPTPMGNFRMYDSGDESIRIISYGDIFSLPNIPLVRIHSSCLASEVFGAMDCDCADQLRESMKIIASEKKGLIIHLHQEGRGQGLSRKIQAVRLMQENNIDTFDSFERLNFKQDVREYDAIVKILEVLNIKSVLLISNNPRKSDFLKSNGISVSCVNTHPNIRPENSDYLHTKNEKLGHNLPINKYTDDRIKFYHSDQPWGEFSNFSKHSIFLDQKIWPTVEHYYQASKFEKMVDREFIRRASTPILAKQFAQEMFTPLLQTEWLEIKKEVMFKGLRAKFSQHPDLTELLISTNDRVLVEHTKNDLFWGDGGDGSGNNQLGQLLMLLRKELCDQASIKARVEMCVG